MRIFAFVGVSDSGKTRLILRLLDEFRRRGKRTGVIKHCHEDFDLDPEGKDSSRFWEKGAAGIALLSPSRWATIRRIPPERSAAELADRLFPDMDIVLVEGGKQSRDIPKIAVGRSETGEDSPPDPAGLVAVVSEEDASPGMPVFHPDQIREIADFIWNEGEI